jgi:hypothetical protein
MLKRILNPYRLAAVLLSLFFVLHTAGGMFGRKSHGFAADSVFALMQSVHFDFGGASCSYYDFWMGFGLMVSAFLLLSAVMAWQLAKVEPRDWHSVEVIAWALFAAHVCNAVLSWKYFFAAPGVMSIVVVLCLGAGAVSKKNYASE